MINQPQQQVAEYLLEENRVLREQIGSRRIRFNDDQRRRLDHGELVTLPSLHEGDEWTRFEAARRAMSEKFGNSQPAPRYGIRMRRSA
jgi:hypothetical protein